MTGEVDVTPSEALTLSFSRGLGKDNSHDSYFGLQEATFRTFSASADYDVAAGVGVGGTYNYERYAGLQLSRSASPGDQFVDPTRDWTTDSRERVHYFSVYVNPPRIGTKTEMRVSYDYAYATATTSIASDRRCRRHLSCRRPSTSSRTSGSTSGIG